MPSIPHGTPATQKWAGCFIFAKPGLFCAESHPSPVPTPKGSSLERGKGREKYFSHGYNSCFRGCCVYPAIPSADHKAATLWDAATSRASILDTSTGDLAATLAGRWQHHFLQERERVTVHQQSERPWLSPGGLWFKSCSLSVSQEQNSKVPKFQKGFHTEAFPTRTLCHQRCTAPWC